MRVPLTDLRAQYDSIRSEAREALDGVLESGQFVLGAEVEAFEQEFAAYCGTQYAVALNSCTSALHLALLACGVGADDEVITAPNSFIATCHAIAYTGARPVFVDIDPTTRNIDPSRIEEAITPRTKALLPVHLYGSPADLDPILRIGEKHGLTVIEDAAQAHGARYKGRRVGALGRIGCFSFYPSKNLGAYGEGGMLVTSDADVAQRSRALRLYGQSDRHRHDEVGYNYKMDALQAAVLRVKLRHLEAWNDARREHANQYNARLQDADVSTPFEPEFARDVYHLYVVRSRDRDAVTGRMAQSGVEFGLHYPIPCHLQQAFRWLGYGGGRFPEAEALARECISLPMFAELTEEQISRVVEVVRGKSGGGR